MSARSRAAATCPVCMVLRALEVLHQLELGRDVNVRSQTYKMNGKPPEYPWRAGYLAGNLEQVARDARGYCRKHAGGRGRAELGELFAERRQELRQFDQRDPAWIKGTVRRNSAHREVCLHPNAREARDVPGMSCPDCGAVSRCECGASLAHVAGGAGGTVKLCPECDRDELAELQA